MIDKLYKNALITEKLNKISKLERQQIIIKLLETRSERELSEELGIPHSTIHDWKTLRQNNTEENIHISLTLIIRRLKHYKPKTILDHEQLKIIYSLVKNKLEKKEVCK